MKALILDDEPYCGEALFHLLARHCPHIQPVALFSDPEVALQAYAGESPDILFLDVEMPFMSGFDFLKAIGPVQTSVIFTTAHDEYAIRAFKVNAIDYLLKPIDRTDLIRAVQKVTERPQQLNEQVLSGLIKTAIQQQQSPRKVTIHTADGIHLLSLDDIIYCQSDGAYSHIHLSGQSPILVSKNLSEMEALIQSVEFFRVHKSYLINRNHALRVEKSDGGDVIMSNQDRIPISRQRKAEFFTWLSDSV